MIGNVIKSYLISLGMQVDQKTFDQADNAIESLEDGVKSFSNTVVKSFAAAGTAIIGTIATVNVAIAKFLGGLAQTDLENQKFATQMWISHDAAAELNNTLKAMNATIEDLYLSPELLRNFQQLRSTINEMKPPAEFKDQMKFIRSIQFEFQRLRLEGTYALQWIGFYLFKYLEGPIRSIKEGFSNFNDSLVESMPEWTRSIAQVLSWFVRLGHTIIQAGRDIFKLFDRIGDMIPTKIKVIGAALLALGIIMKTGPFGIFLTLISAGLLLLEDFYTYLRGGKSAFEPLWRRLQEFYQVLKDTGVIERLQQVFLASLDMISRAIYMVGDALIWLFERGKELSAWLYEFFGELNKEGLLSGLLMSFGDFGKEILNLVTWVGELIAKFFELEQVKSILQGIGDFLKDTFTVALENIKSLLDKITATMKIVRTYFSGDDAGFEQALNEMENVNNRQTQANLAYAGKVGTFANYALFDENAPNPYGNNNANIAREIEPSFKKALNDSELVKGFRTYTQDLKSGLNLMAMAINPEIYDRYQAMSAGTYDSSYAYSTNSNQTIIRNDNNAVFHITAPSPQAAAQEVQTKWMGLNSMNLRNIRPVNG